MRISDWSSDVCSSDLVKDGIAALLNYRKLARAQDNVLASTWVSYLKRGRTFEWSADMDRKIAALTPDAVNEIGRASCRERVVSKCRSRWSATHEKKKK